MTEQPNAAPQPPRPARTELGAEDLVRMWRGFSAVSEEAIPTLRSLASRVGLELPDADPLAAVARREAARVKAEEAILARVAELARGADVDALGRLAELVTGLTAAPPRT